MFDLLEIVLPYSLPEDRTDEEAKMLCRAIKQHLCLLKLTWSAELKSTVIWEEAFAKRFANLTMENLLGYEYELIKPNQSDNEEPAFEIFLRIRYQALLNFIISAPINSPLFRYLYQHSFLANLGKLLHTPDLKEAEMVRKLWMAILYQAAKVADQEAGEDGGSGDNVEGVESGENGVNGKSIIWNVRENEERVALMIQDNEENGISMAQEPRDNAIPMVQEPRENGIAIYQEPRENGVLRAQDIINSLVSVIQAGFYDLKELGTGVSIRPIGRLVVIFAGHPLIKVHLQQIYLRFAIPLFALPSYAAFSENYETIFLRLAKISLGTPFHLEMFQALLRCSFRRASRFNDQNDIPQVRFILSLWMTKRMPVNLEAPMHKKLLKHVRCKSSERTRRYFLKALISPTCVEIFSGTSIVHHDRFKSNQILAIILTELCEWLLKGPNSQLTEDALCCTLGFWLGHSAGRLLFPANPHLLQLAIEVTPLISQHKEKQALQMAPLYDQLRRKNSDMFVLSSNTAESPPKKTSTPLPKPNCNLDDFSDPEETMGVASLDDFA